MPTEDALRAQQRLRMSHMPWLYFRAKPAVRAWAEPWQAEVQTALAALEDVVIEPGCFVAPEARVFAEPHRPVVLRAGASIAAGAFVHGPVELGPGASVNVRATLDGGRAGIRVGAGTRIATGATLFAFDHGLDPGAPVAAQPVRSRGITIGADVWIGANAGVTDGVTVGDHAVVAMGAVVTRDVAPWTLVAGVPARPIGDRRARGPIR